MNNIYDYISAQEIAAYIENLPSNSLQYIGASLFPNRQASGLDISWLKGSNGLPIAIQPAEYDTKASLRERGGFGKRQTELAFFREATRIGERDRQELSKLMNQDLGFARPIIQNIFEDVNKIVQGVDAMAEYMRMQLLQKGKFTVKSTNESVAYEYDYKMSAEHQIQVTDLWSDPVNSDPINDIIAAQDKIESDTGVRPTRIILNRKTFNYMVSSQSIKRSLMIGVAGDFNDLRISNTQAQAYIEAETQTTIVVYNKQIAMFKDANAIPTLDYTNSIQLIEDGNVVLLPPATLGSTWYGTTPEEMDLRTGVTDAKVQTLSNGPTITTYMEPHPVNVAQIVSAVIAPSFEQIDNVGVLKVTA